MEGKNIAGTIMLLLAGVFFVVGQWLYQPTSWIGYIGDFFVEWLFIGLAIWTAVIAVFLFAMEQEKVGYLLGFWMFVPLAIVSWGVPLDPIPWIDEIITMLGVGFFGIKSLAPAKVQAKIPMF